MLVKTQHVVFNNSFFFLIVFNYKFLWKLTPAFLGRYIGRLMMKTMELLQLSFWIHAFECTKIHAGGGAVLLLALTYFREALFLNYCA